MKGQVRAVFQLGGNLGRLASRIMTACFPRGASLGRLTVQIEQHQAQQLAAWCTATSSYILPCLGRIEIDRQNGAAAGRSAVEDSTAFASTARAVMPVRRARSFARSRGSPAAARQGVRFADQPRKSTGTLAGCRRLRSHPRRDRAGPIRKMFRRLRTTGCGSPAGFHWPLACLSSGSGCDQDRQGELHRRRRAPRRTSRSTPRAAATSFQLCTIAWQPGPVQHDRVLRPRPLPRKGWLSGTRMASVHEFRARHRAARTARGRASPAFKTASRRRRRAPRRRCFRLVLSPTTFRRDASAAITRNAIH